MHTLVSSSKRVLSLLLSLCVIFTLASCHKQEAPPPPKMEVTISHPIKKKIIEWDEYTGRFQATDKVEVRARVSGYLEEIRFRDGDMVSKGDVLFVIDQRPYKIAVDAAKAQLESAEAKEELSQKNIDRAKKLYQEGAISKQDYDSRIQEQQVNVAGTVQGEATVNNALLNLDFTEVRAPISGRISRHYVSEGNLVSGGGAESTLLTTIVSVDPIYFYFDASESNLLKYVRLNKSGQRTSSRTKANPLYVKLLDEDEYKHLGYMNFVDNELDPGTGTMMARAVFNNADGTLEPGLFGRARLPGSGEYEATLIPDELIGTDQTKKYVFVTNEKNEVVIKFIELGPLHDNGLRIVKSGLEETDNIISSNLMKIRPGMKVKPVEKKEETPETKE